MRSISAFEQTLVAGGDYSPDAFSDGFAGNGWQGGGAMCPASPYESFNVGNLSYPGAGVNANTQPTSSFGLLSPVGFVMDAFAIGVGIGTLIYNAVTGK